MPLDIESLKNSVGGLLQSDVVQNAKSRIRELAQSDELQAVLPYLLSGGAGALAGGLVTRRPADEDESRAGYLGRILRNALLTGGLAAGGHYLIGKGLESTVGSSAPVPDAPKAPDKGPLETAVRNIAFSPFTAAGAGASALYATNKTPHIGSDPAGRDAFLTRFRTEDAPGAPSSKHLRHTATAKEVGDIERAQGSAYNSRSRRMAGLPSDLMETRHDFLRKIPQSVLDRIPGIKDAHGKGDVQALKGLLSTALRKGPLSTFGQSFPRRAMRGTLGLTAAGIPALIGAFLTGED